MTVSLCAPLLLHSIFRFRKDLPVALPFQLGEPYVSKVIVTSRLWLLTLGLRRSTSNIKKVLGVKKKESFKF